MSDPRTASDPWPRAAEGLRMSEPPAPEPAPPPDDLPGERHRRRRKPSTLRSVIEWGVIIVVALVGALIIRTTEGDIKDLVKRVIGLPGETIQSTSDGHIEINGAALSESYLPPGTALGPPIPKQVIPSGHYFVMGDNRTDSSDSRFFGPIARSQIIGRAFILIWPLSDFHFL